MTAAERSIFGLAKQTGVGVPVTTDPTYKYFLFNQGAAGVNNVVVPLDSEVGGGAMLRDMIKAGVTTGGALEFIPRPDTLGTLLLGILGKDTVVGATAPYTHTLTMDPADQFAAPYYTMRFAPGGLWAEQYQDIRINALTIDFKAASFLRGSVGFIGGLPMKMAAVPTAAHSAQPPFTSPNGVIELPTGTAVKVLSGSFTAGAAIPLDEQFVIGSYVPDGFDITQRAFALSFNVKIADNVLYQKMAYDPAGGSIWLAKMFKEGSFKLEFKSEKDITVGNPHKLTIAAHPTEDNVAWSVTPIGLRAGRQVIATVTGVFLASSAGAPITVTLINEEATY